MQKRIKEAKGITLVALIITVIILLILAGVTISLVIGENGLIAKSKEGVNKYKDKAKEEQWQLEDFEKGMEQISIENLKDETEHPELKQMKLLLYITEDNKTISLPVYSYGNGKYDCEVDWGDGTTVQVTNEEAKTTKHTYEKTGEYMLVIEGTYESLYVEYNNISMQKALKKVEQWGATGLKRIYLGSCTNLEKIAEPSKNSFINVTYFGDIFRECSSLTAIPEKLFANCSDVELFRYTFSGCSSLRAIPERLFANCTKVTNFDETFSGCSSLRAIPERLFVNCTNVQSFEGTFEGCENLENIPKNLFDNCSKVEKFDKTFYMCSNLKGKSIELWKRNNEKIAEDKGGFGCFFLCEGLEDYQDIPEYWRHIDDGPR